MTLWQDFVPVWGEVDSEILVPRVFMDGSRLHKIKVWKTRFDSLRSIHCGRRVWRACGLENKVLELSKDRESRSTEGNSTDEAMGARTIYVVTCFRHFFAPVLWKSELGSRASVADELRTNGQGT